MKVSIDGDCCIASGACVIECPEVFGQDDEGLVVVLLPEPPAELHKQARAAMTACPAAVISIEEVQA